MNPTTPCEVVTSLSGGDGVVLVTSSLDLVTDPALAQAVEAVRAQCLLGECALVIFNNIFFILIQRKENYYF